MIFGNIDLALEESFKEINKLDNLLVTGDT